MWITTEGLRTIVQGRNVDSQVLITAQRIIESYVGRTEAEVDDPRDIAMLARATAFQAVYLETNGAVVFEQIKVAQLAQGGQSVTFKAGDDVSPYIAPLAVIACRNLSWKKARSIKTGRVFQRPEQQGNWWTD